MRHRSKKRARQDRADAVARREYMASAGWKCQVGAVLRSASLEGAAGGRMRGDLAAGGSQCARTADGLHELRKRSAQGSTTNPANLLAACNPCNIWIEDHPALAHDLGLVARPGDPEWDALAAAPTKVVPR